MKKAKLLLLPLIASSLCSCYMRSSHYNSIMMISENRNESCRLTFDLFEGNYVFKMKKTSPGEATVSYKVTLGTGKADVTYSIESIAGNQKETLLCTVTSGETLEGTFGYVEKGYKVYINIVSDGKIEKGDFQFQMNK